MTDLLEHARWEEPTWEDRAPGPRRWPWVLLGLVVLLGALYAGAAWWLGERVPRGTTVAGVPLGGQTAAEARTTLERAVAGRAQEPILLTSKAGQARIRPERAGVVVDVDATVAGLTGFSMGPRELWHHVNGGVEQPAVVTVDREAFAAAVDKVRKRLDSTAKEGRLSVRSGTVQYRAPVRGTTTDAAGTAAVIERWWPAQDSVEVEADPVLPRTPAAEFERVRAEFADVAVSGPVTVRADGKRFRLTPKQFASALRLPRAKDGTITPRADQDELRSLVHAAAQEAGVEREPKDASVSFAPSGYTKRTVHRGRAGLTLLDESISEQVWKAVTTTDRTANVLTKAVRPTWTVTDIRRTLPKEKVASFTTQFQCCQSRVENIRRGAAAVDGTYVLPGQQFSLNDVLGDTTTKESGYLEAGIIRYGRAATSYGGGLSQVSTTVFNASFFAGVRLDAWSPHSYYISRYPEGREATISYPDLHNKWTNTLDGGILVRARTTDTSITVTYYGTKKYRVTATKGDRYAIEQPTTIVDDDPECIPQQPVEGFSVDIGRIFHRGGEVVDRQSFTTRYDPQDDVTCTNPRAG
ncbi:VanW family protein [Phycicoccus flavus]|uniref:VanW family protein n=1 Tax=Phycicoccus flavus TaxID=2502783 RepID=A0A8T6R5I8_9MICO|nr:VanW family protein [Phycicoccus flavus]NHA68730.1 VanW family protein [Phycicoccus flavus]